MENIKKNPVLMGILSAVGCAALLFALEFVLSLINQKPFREQISSTLVIIILIAGPIFSGISTYIKTKEKVEGKEKKQ